MARPEFEGFIPNFSGILENPRAEQMLFTAFLRIYEYFTNKLKLQQEAIEKLIAKGDEISTEDLNGLLGIFSTPLAGSSTGDPLLEGIVQSFGTQGANNFFAGPTPSFRPIAVADIPVLTLAKLPTNVLKTDDNLTENVVGAPNVNTGKVILKDNNGNTITVMTCA